jgi:membrane-bound lytic murein transglycosylase D
MGEQDHVLATDVTMLTVSPSGLVHLRPMLTRRKDTALVVALTALCISSLLSVVTNSQPLAPLAAVAAGVSGAAETVVSLPETAAIPSVETVPWDLPNLDHPRVDYWVEQFQTKRRDDFSIFLTRKEKYALMISEKLAARAMPQDLIYLAMIESGFNPNATSPARAKGLWQFIKPTAQRYGLRVNRRTDERTDPVKSTEAALEYLSDLHQQFGSWYLAAAAYNSGENRVARIMRKATGSEKGSEESYYEIADLLPKETADYVPLMIAAARIAKEPAKYGFDTRG